MYIFMTYDHRQRFLKLSGVVIRWPTKAPAYAVDVTGGGGGGGGGVGGKASK